MRTLNILLSVAVITLLSNNSFSQTPDASVANTSVTENVASEVSSNTTANYKKKYELIDGLILEVKDITRTGQGALIIKFKVTRDNQAVRIYAYDSKLTDLSTKTVYHVMNGSGTHSGHSYNPWAMITEPPTSLKSALFQVHETNESVLPPVIIDLP